MKIISVGSVALVLMSLVYSGCSGAASDPVGTTGADLSSAPSTAAGGLGGTTTAAGGVHRDPLCPAGEKICRVKKATGVCGDVCVRDTDFCVSDCPSVATPTPTPACDPATTPPPRPGCTFDTTSCEWDCPVCDPVGTPPHQGCSWSSTACEWECPICDPPPPPEPAGCQFDEAHCVWICA